MLAKYKLSANFLMVSQFSTEAANFSLFVQVQIEDGGTRCSCTRDSLKAVNINREKNSCDDMPHVTTRPPFLFDFCTEKS